MDRKLEYIRNFVFGVEDSLVSTVGLVSGIAVTGMSRQNIVLTGIVLVFVEAFSMGVGSLLSQNSVQEFEGKKAEPLRSAFGGSIIMFISYLLSGFLVVLPYALTVSEAALPWSIIISLVGLFSLGAVSGKFSNTSPLKKGATMSLLGGFAIAIGMIVGILVKQI